MPGEAQNLGSEVAAAQEAGVVVDKWTRWMIAVAVMMSAVMELVDTSAVNVSLPYIAGNLSATVNEATWILTSYLIANAIILPVSGWLANYFGRRRLLMISVVGFSVASILCGLAPTLPLLVFFRILQGAAGGRCNLLRERSCWRRFRAKSAGTQWRCGARAS
jgi:MFS transporter, DHA2 family, multidrug resistance protein